MYGLGQFHHWQNKGEERRGEIWQKKSNSCLANIEQQLMAKIAKKTAVAPQAAHWTEENLNQIKIYS